MSKNELEINIEREILAMQPVIHMLHVTEHDVKALGLIRDHFRNQKDLELAPLAYSVIDRVIKTNFKDSDEI